MEKEERTEYLENIKRLEKKLVDLEIEFLKELKAIPKPSSFSEYNERAIILEAESQYSFLSREIDKLSDIDSIVIRLKVNLMENCATTNLDTQFIVLNEFLLHYYKEKYSLMLRLVFAKSQVQD